MMPTRRFYASLKLEHVLVIPSALFLLGKHIKQIEYAQFRTNRRKELLSEMLQKMDTGVAREAKRRAGAFISVFESAAMEEYPAFERAKHDVLFGKIWALEMHLKIPLTHWSAYR
jgi:hypothetical protein